MPASRATPGAAASPVSVPPGHPLRLLVVEDELKVAEALRQGLEGEGYDVVVETSGEAAFFRLTADRFDLILLDLHLPGRNGIEILSTMRRRGLQTPVVVLTARDTLADRVVGLDAGADDYIVKPFAFAELLARIRAVARRGTIVSPHDLPRAAASGLRAPCTLRYCLRKLSNPAGVRLGCHPRLAPLSCLRCHDQIARRAP